MVGERLGSYLLVRQIGAGGMGAVYEGRHDVLENRAAVKVLLPDLSRDEDAVKRFFNEARAATRIKHPGIVQIFDFGTHTDGSAYFVMELLEGQSLATRLRSGQRPGVEELATIGKQLAGVLSAAHAAGIVHRDLKPDNVFLVPDPDIPGGVRVKVLDFGIAKLAATGQAPVSVKTRTGAVIGTPYYMSPEQCRGSGEIDHRADIYSLGCVLFEMAAGRPPFTGSGLGEVLGAHQFVPPPALRSLNPGVPPKLETLIQRTLGKSPDERPQSMTLLGAELEEATRGAAGASSLPFDNTVAPGLTSTTLGGATGERTGDRKRGRTRTLYLAGGAGVLAVAAAVVWLVTGSESSPRASPSPTPSAPPAPIAVIDAAPVAPELNGWVTIAPPPPGAPVLLGVADARAPATVSGFRPTRKIAAPATAYQMHEHEVTWGELEPWLAGHPEHAVTRPAALPAGAAERARLPAGAVPWLVAKAFCRDLGGSLPSEAQWEYAARGRERRPYPWGDDQLDLMRTRAFAGPGAGPGEVMVSDQDRTPPPVLYDLAGNLQEWTSDLWREDAPGQDESWVQAGDVTFRAVRGLPLAVQLGKAKLPVEGAAFREALCATGKCPADTAAILATVGFRCVRGAR